MITLAAAETLQGIATSATTVTYTLTGLELAGTTDAAAGTPKILAQGQLPSSVGVLYTVGAGAATLVKGIHLANQAGSTQTVDLYVNGTAAANNIVGLQIPANGSAIYDGQWNVYDQFGNIQQGVVTGYALDSAVVHLAGAETITGVKTFNSNVPIRGPHPWVDVTAYGADPTGVTDSTSAIQSAITAALGGTCYFPAGVYLITSALAINAAVTLRGSATYHTYIMTNNPTANAITCNSGSVVIEDLLIMAPYTTTTSGGTLSGTPQAITVASTGGFPASGTISIGLTNTTWTTFSYTSITGNTLNGCTGSGAFSAGAPVHVKTGGYAISLGVTATNLVRRVSIYSMFDGIEASGVATTIIECIFEFMINRGVVVNNVQAGPYIHNVLMDCILTNPSAACVEVIQCANVIMSDCQFMRARFGMNLNSTASGIASVWVVNTAFDNCTTAGLQITGSGACTRLKFMLTWFASSTNGVVLNNASAQAIDFDNCDFYLNSANGILSTACAEWSVKSSRIAQNTTAGINIAASSPAPDISITDNLIGAETGGLAGNGTGIILGSGAYANLQISGNTLAGNSTAAFTDNGGTVANPGQKRISENLGLSIQPRPMITTPANITTTAETIVLPQMYCPANSLLVGTTIRFTVHGSITATTPTLQARIRIGPLGTTADAQVCATVAAVVQTGAGFVAQGYLTIRTIGSSGTCLGNAWVAGGNAAGGMSAQTATVPVNTTVANFLSFSLKAGSSSITVTPVNAFVEVVAQ